MKKMGRLGCWVRIAYASNSALWFVACVPLWLLFFLLDALELFHPSSVLSFAYSMFSLRCHNSSLMSQVQAVEVHAFKRIVSHLECCGKTRCTVLSSFPSLMQFQGEETNMPLPSEGFHEHPTTPGCNAHPIGMVASIL